MLSASSGTDAVRHGGRLLRQRPGEADLSSACVFFLECKEGHHWLVGSCRAACCVLT